MKTLDFSLCIVGANCTQVGDVTVPTNSKYNQKTLRGKVSNWYIFNNKFTKNIHTNSRMREIPGQ